MFHNAWRKFQILVYLTFIPVFMIELLPLGQFVKETLLEVSLMGYLLIFIHGLRIAVQIMRPGLAVDPKISEAVSGLYDMEGGF
jgi:hypothetical protein